jgi:hypothetical protein
MLSIIIPNYNTDITNIVEKIHNQCLICEFNFEILVLEDGSSTYLNTNKKLNLLTNVDVFIRLVNKGRMPTRYELVEKSKYNNLLLVDSDIIINDNFIENYKPYLENFQVVFGGNCYRNFNHSENNHKLRYLHGLKNESHEADFRNKKPYLYIFSSNLLIKKEIFLSLELGLESKYGTDILVSYKLFKNSIEVLHINNPIIHLGIDEDVDYFNKKIEASKNAYLWYKINPEIRKVSKLLNLYHYLKKFKLRYILGFIFKKNEKKLYKNIFNKTNKLFWINIYKLGYICSLKD